MRSFLLAMSTALTVSAAAGEAATVMLDFSGGSNVDTSFNSNPNGQDTISGTWQEDGFDVAWDLWWGNDFPDPATIASFTGFTDLADQHSGFATGIQMTLTRAGGGSFSLSGVDTNSAYEGYTVGATFTPFAADGTTLDYSSETNFTAPVLRPSLSFSGLTSSGSVVTTDASVTSAAISDLSSYSGQFFGAGSAVFAPGTLASFTDLTSLTITVGGGTSSLNAAGAKSLVDFGAPTNILQGFNQCGFNYCVIPGVGAFYSYIDYPYSPRNDLGLADIAAISLTTLDPSPVPLPASAVMLFGALALLGAARLKCTG